MRSGPAGGAAIVVAILAALGAPALAMAQATPGSLHVASFRAPASVVHGDRAEIWGRVAPAAALPVLVERLEAGAWTPLVTLTSAANGRFRARLPLARTSNLRVSVQLADGTLSSSRRRSVALRRRVSLAVSAPLLENIAGRPFVASGAVVPAAPGERVALQGSVDGRPFRTIARVVVRAGRVRARFTPPGGGSWRFRIAADATAGRDQGGNATSPAMAVYGANPHGAPVSAPHFLVQKISDFHLYYYQYGKLRRVFVSSEAELLQEIARRMRIVGWPQPRFDVVQRCRVTLEVRFLRQVADQRVGVHEPFAEINIYEAGGDAQKR